LVKYISTAILILVITHTVSSQNQRDSKGTDSTTLKKFELHLEKLRKKHSIPSLSAGVARDDSLFWKKGFGYADIENQIIPDENTIYHLASITKTFGSIILLQLVEQGKVKLNDPVTKYDIHLGARWNDDSRIQVQHLLTHTSQGNTLNAFKPGYSFHYNGDYYGQLGKVINSSEKSFGELLVENIINPLQLKHTTPTVDDSLNFNLTGYNEESIRKHMAKPYDYDKKRNKTIQIKYPVHFSPAAGLISSVGDLAVYSHAVDEGKFLNDTTWQQVFTPYVSRRGRKLPYGQGWFVKTYNGVKYVWHTGWWQGASSLIIKVPKKKLTFIILANSQDLSRPFYAGFPIYFKRSLHKNLKASPFARAFMKSFVEQ
jgi:CubicO group peptidase (beta-lactamase class C family)